MDYLPLFIDLRQKPCLLVGAGEVAHRKLELLLRAGANVHIVAPQITEAIGNLAKEHDLIVHERKFLPEDVKGAVLVVAATNITEVNRTVFDACRQHNVLVNCVDEPELSTAIFPSIIDRNPVLVAVSTGGRSPTLARVVRGWIETRLPFRLGALAEFVTQRRAEVKRKLTDGHERQRFWDRLLNGSTAERVLRGDTEGAEQSFQNEMKAGDLGSVALVGAGPGDPELITLKGLRLLQSADVVLYDNLANAELLEYARRDADRIYVGKRRKFPGIRQEAINQLMLKHVRAGKFVVRLKGGDPFIFGRSGEETEYLANEGIDCVVVPGITAASGSASYAGIPLTHRDVSQSVRFVTGHRAADRTNLDWPELAKPQQTLVIYMGLPGLKEILERLVEHGMAPDMPAVLVEKATLPEQRVVQGTVTDLAERVKKAEIVGPTTIIIGEVVKYRHP